MRAGLLAAVATTRLLATVRHLHRLSAGLACGGPSPSSPMFIQDHAPVHHHMLEAAPRIEILQRIA